MPARGAFVTLEGKRGGVTEFRNLRALRHGAPVAFRAAGSYLQRGTPGRMSRLDWRWIIPLWDRHPQHRIGEKSRYGVDRHPLAASLIPHHVGGFQRTRCNELP